MPTFNNAQCLELTLRSLTRQTLPADLFEVIVVLDGRMNGYDGIERHAPGIDVRIETLPQRRGRSVARNTGIALAKGEIVLFLDSDCYAAPQLLERHYRFHTGAPAPRVLLGNRHEIGWPHMTFLVNDDPLPAELISSPDYRDIKFHGAADAEIPDRMRTTPWLFAHTNNASVTTETLAASGWFNEDFGVRWGLEDLELFYRVYLRLGRDPESFHHDVEAASYHLVEYRDQRGFYQEMFENISLLRRLHPHLDWEFHSTLSTIDIADKVCHYRDVIDKCLADGVGRVPPVWEWLRPRLPAGRALVIGTGTGQVTMPDGTMTFDYAAPVSESNYHLVGVAMPVSAGALDTVVSVDIWRCLQWHDLCEFLRESTRVASRVLLVHTRAAEVPYEAMRTSGEIGYLLRALESRFVISMERGENGVTGITVRRRA